MIQENILLRARQGTTGSSIYDIKVTGLRLRLFCARTNLLLHPSAGNIDRYSHLFVKWILLFRYERKIMSKSQQFNEHFFWVSSFAVALLQGTGNNLRYVKKKINKAPWFQIIVLSDIVNKRACFLKNIVGFTYDCGIDIWSYACVLAELLMGRPLFSGENEADQLACIMEVIGLPPRRILNTAPRARYFFGRQNFKVWFHLT